jgi:hypothetical protein
MTKPDLSRQSIIPSGSTASFDGSISIGEKLLVQDVEFVISGITSGQTLVYNSVLNKLLPTSIDLNASSTLSGMTDVNFTTLTSGDTILWNSNTNKWENNNIVLNTDSIINTSTVTGSTTTNALDNLNTNKADLVAGKVPSSQLPSYVDDVIEGYYYTSNFYEDSGHTITIIGETSKIYIDLPTNLTYRWSGSIYIEISSTTLLGTTDRITVSGSTIDIASTYTGQTSINTVGGITTGSWSGTPINDTYIDSSSNWNTAYNNRISTFTVTGTSGSATFTGNTLNIPTYTLSGLGGQPQLNGNGFVRSTGTTIGYLTGTTNQFVKADGSVDSNVYLTGETEIAYETWSTNANYTTVNTTAKRLIVLQTGTLTATRTLTLASVTGAGQEVIIVAGGSVSSTIKIIVAVGFKINATLNSIDITIPYSQTLLTSVSSTSWTSGDASSLFTDDGTTAETTRRLKANYFANGVKTSMTGTIGAGDFQSVLINSNRVGFSVNSTAGLKFIPAIDGVSYWSQEIGGNTNLKFWDGSDVGNGAYAPNTQNIYYGGWNYFSVSNPTTYIEGYYYNVGTISQLIITKPTSNAAALQVALTGGKIAVTTNSGLTFAKQQLLNTWLNSELPLLNQKYSTTGLANYWTGSEGLGIGHTSQNASAILQADSTTKGSLVNPRMTTTQKLAIASPATGLEVFDTTLNVPQYYNGTAWVSLLSGSISNGFIPYYNGSSLVNSRIRHNYFSVGTYVEGTADVGVTQAFSVYNNSGNIPLLQIANSALLTTMQCKDFSIRNEQGTGYSVSISPNGTGNFGYQLFLFTQAAYNQNPIGVYNEPNDVYVFRILSSGEIRNQAVNSTASTIISTWRKKDGTIVVTVQNDGLYVGSGTKSASASLQTDSTTQGSLPAPRMTAAQRVAIASPVAGLIVYQTDVHAGYWYHDGTIWQDLSQPRVGTTASSATPTINTDVTDYYEITGQTVDITSFTTNLTGTPVRGQKLWIDITGTAARAITWGASFEASTIALPTTTVSTDKLSVDFIWNVATSKWRCIGAY